MSVFEVGLREVSLRIGYVVSISRPDLVENMSHPSLTQIARSNPFINNLLHCFHSFQVLIPINGIRALIKLVPAKNAGNNF